MKPGTGGWWQVCSTRYELGVHGAQAVDRSGGLGSMTTLDPVGAPGSRHSTAGEGALSQPGQLLVLCSLARPATSCGRSRAG